MFHPRTTVPHYAMKSGIRFNHSMKPINEVMK